MSRDEALNTLAEYLDEKTKDYLVAWNTTTLLVAFLRDNPHVAQALGIGGNPDMCARPAGVCFPVKP